MTERVRIGAVILAAGFSSRMGGFKPLLNLGGMTVLARCVRLFRDQGVGRIMVATGHRASEVQEEAGRLGVLTVHNEHYEQGMFSSVCTAVATMTGMDAFFLLPVDIPLVRPATVATLLARYQGRILFPVFGGERGHPPLIPQQVIPAIMDHGGQDGLRGVLERHPAEDVPVWDRGILCDADTPDDFARLQACLGRLAVGEREEALALAGQTMPERGLAHGLAVATVALRLGEELNAHGLGLDLELIHNAALLHDVAKGRPGHEAAGGKMLSALGLDGLSAIVAGHRDVPPPVSGVPTEKEIVFLADKLVRCDRRIALEERFGEKLALYAGDAAACRAIDGRLRNALAVRDLVERICKRPVEHMLAGVLP